MGMYSSFNFEDIVVTDSKGLVNFLLKIKEKDIKNYYEYMYKQFLENVIDGEQYSFSNWDDIKLISYWYDHQVIFLSLIAKYIEGYVVWDYETGEEKAQVIFKNGKALVKLGEMVFHSLPTENLLADRGISGIKLPKITIKTLFKSMYD